MAGKALKLTEKKIADMIQAGRGQGEGADYQPWIQVGNFSSEGRGHRIADIHTGRIHHFFSDLEASYYYILAWADQVIDIREQYPLFPVSDTEEIAQALGYRHPRAPGNSISEVMTTDFLITVQDASGTHLEARHVMYEKDWKKPRETEKREIEAIFWENRDVSFKSVTEKSINKVKVANIKRLLSYHDANRFQTESPQVVAVLLEDMVSRFHDCSYDPLKDFCTQLEWRTNARQGLALELLFHLAAHKCIPVQIEKQLVATKPLTEVIDFSRLPRIPTLMEELNERFA